MPPGWLTKRNRPTEFEVARQTQLALRQVGRIAALWRTGTNTMVIAGLIGATEYAVERVVHRPEVWPLKTVADG